MSARTEDFLVNMGPQHPSTHGVFRAILGVDGEVVVSAEPVIGYLHRGIEKIAESRTYPQGIPLTDRLDYLAAMSNNLVYCLAVEKLLAVEPPERATVIRTIVAELQRIASHLVFLGCYGLDTGAVTAFLYTFREREHVMDLFEKLCGQRLIYNYMRFGGVAHDLPEGFEAQTEAFLAELDRRIAEYDELLTGNHIFHLRTKGIGIIPRDVALSHALSGPALRASGVDYDVRRHEPYLIYDRLAFDTVVLDGCDCFDRYRTRLHEMTQSSRIIRQCLPLLKPGPVLAKVPRAVKPPAGECYVHIESPRGDLGAYLVSDGTDRPFRIKYRAPSFVNLSVFKKAAPGLKIADLVVLLGSLDPVFGEVDR